MSASRIRTALVALALALGAWMTLGSSAAVAKYVHSYEGSFNGSDTPRGSLGFVLGAAVDNSSGPSAGDVYLASIAGLIPGAPGTVQKFGPEGKYAGVEFTGSETPQGSFGMLNFLSFSVGAVAVDGSAGANAGDVYVADVEHGVIDRFSEGGEFLCQITGKAPSTPAEEVEFEEYECAGKTGSATPSGGFGTPDGVAVDPVNGDVYAADLGATAVDEFNAAGEYIGQITDSHLTRPGSLAFDSSGDLYVDNGSLISAGENIVKFNSSGSFVEALAAGQSPVSVAVDTSNDHLYAYSSEAGEAVEYSSSGALLGSFGKEQEPGIASVAASASNGDVYIASTGQKALIYGPGAVVPEADTAGAANVGEAKATLNGEAVPDVADGGGDVTSCEFEYVDAAAYEKAVEEHSGNPYATGKTVPCSPATPYAIATTVSAEIDELTRSTTYHYRLVAADAEGKGRGEDRTFTTTGPAQISEELSNARTGSATVRAQINPYGYETTCEVQYVTDAAYEASEYEGAASIPCPEAIPAGFGDQQVRVNLSGLSISTAYHYRFVAHNGATSQGGVTLGEDATFTTFKIESLSVKLINEKGEPFAEAGGHPYEMRVKFTFNTTELEAPHNDPTTMDATGNLKTAKVELPPGLIGNPTAVPTCTAGELKREDCPPEAEVGGMYIYSAQNSARGGDFTDGGLYNLDPPTGVAAEFGTQFNSFPSVRIDSAVRTGSDYGINSVSVAVNADTGVDGVEVRIWGVPAEESHPHECRGSRQLCSSTAPARPLLSDPTSCSGPLTARLSAETWQEPGVFVTASDELPAITGCNRIEFEPSIEARPTTKAADSPSGLNVDLHVPQNEDPAGLRVADLKEASVTLPPGLVVNPSGANGLEACTPAEVDMHGAEPANCPAAAKLGTVEVDTPLIGHPLPGGVYLATPYDNPFNSLLALYIAVDDPISGVVVKLAGHVEANPQTGRVTATFDENPQLPFEDFKLNFFGGAKAALRTPATCGTYSTSSVLTPWSAPESGPPATPSDTYQIDQGSNGGACPASEGVDPNAPSFNAGTEAPIAGTYSPFVVHLSREDGSQQFSSVTLTPPPGLVAKLADTPYCPEADLAAARARSGSEERADPSCPAASEIGTVTVGAGAGPAPYYVQGHAYLTGPYKGAPLGMAIITPATAGPFDLGVVVVRVALNVNPETTQITAVSDPIPSILEGIPLDVRSVTMKLGRPEFTLNPTSCDPMTVGGGLLSTLGQSAALSNRFQVANCTNLGFAPKLSARVFGKTRRGGNPRLQVTLSMPAGGANIASASVALPHSEFLDQSHIRTVCTRVQFAADACPAGSVYGHARAFSPLLAQPLEGPVYLRSSSHQLPDLVADLNGQINVVLDGRIDSNHGGIRTTFETVPDAPVSKFVLQMQGGKKGLLQNSTNICRSQNLLVGKFDAHSGKVSDIEPPLKAQCSKGSKKRSGKRHQRHQRKRTVG